MSSVVTRPSLFFFFFFNDTATTEIYTLSLHDALPISATEHRFRVVHLLMERGDRVRRDSSVQDRKSTRLNSSHLVISYAVFCLKKKKTFHDENASIEPLACADRG